MTALATMALLGAASFATAAPAAETTRYLVKVSGMDCASCNAKITGALEALEPVLAVHASFAEQAACFESREAVDEVAVQAAITGLGYAFVGIEEVSGCPPGLNGKLPAPWARRSEGLDVVTISRGETVDLVAHLADGKYTVVDFGAPWCGPCHEAAEALAAYMRTHEDVAVRAVDLEGQTPDASYAQPVVAQHLEYVSGIPWLIAYTPNGKVLVRHRSVEKITAAIDKHRRKQK